VKTRAIKGEDAGDQGVQTRASKVCRRGRSRGADAGDQASRGEDAGDQGVKTLASKVCRRGRARFEDAGDQGVKTWVSRV
jgi:hypothetical protein